MTLHVDELARLHELLADLDAQADLFDDPRAYRAGVSDTLRAVGLRPQR